MKKKFLLGGILFIYLTGTFSVFTAFFKTYHRSNFQETVRETESTKTERLFFTDAQYYSLVWLEEGSEFEWNGKMYDVNKTVRTKNGVEVYCLNDEWEEKIASLFSDWKQLPSPVGKTKLYLQPQFCNALDSCTVFPYPTKADPNSHRDNSYCQPTISFTPPPPEAVNGVIIFYYSFTSV